MKWVFLFFGLYSALACQCKALDYARITPGVGAGELRLNMKASELSSLGEPKDNNAIKLPRLGLVLLFDHKDDKNVLEQIVIFKVGPFLKVGRQKLMVGSNMPSQQIQERLEKEGVKFNDIARLKSSRIIRTIHIFEPD